MPNSHLWAVRKKIGKEIDKLEGKAELTEEGTPLWQWIQDDIEKKKRQLFTLEFMVYNGGEECEAR